MRLKLFLVYERPLEKETNEMTQEMKNGLFISFEGVDACGKSTQAELLYEFLRKKGKEVIRLRDPGATPISEAIRTILLDNRNDAMSPWAELLLYEAARAQMVDESIKPALDAGQVVLCDRFYDSTTAYQGYARGLDLTIVDQANQIGSIGLTPDVTFVIDVDPKIAVERKIKLGEPADRMEAEGFLFQEKVRGGYLKIADHNPDRVKLIDGSQSINDIQDQIRLLLQPIM
jgi:dTMP kinase